VPLRRSTEAGNQPVDDPEDRRTEVCECQDNRGTDEPGCNGILDDGQTVFFAQEREYVLLHWFFLLSSFPNSYEFDRRVAGNAGADGLQSISINFDQFEVNGNGPVSVDQTLSGPVAGPDGSLIFSGSITADLDGEAGNETLDFTLTLRMDGDRIGSTLHCGDCERPFDMDFSLAELVSHLGTESGTDAGDRVRLPDGRSCRLPTGEDEIAVADLAPEQAALALADRLLTGGTLSAPSDEDGLAALQRHLAERAPGLDLDLEAACPECGAGQPVRFDIQSYLLTSLLQEQERLVYEVHRLARAYGWHLDEILGLPRRLRRRHVGLIEAEIEAAGRD